MKKKTVILSILLILSAFSYASAAPKCDRACMVAIMDQYLAAVVKHNPAGVPLASDVKFVQNMPQKPEDPKSLQILQQIPIGKGLWETATGGPTEFKIYIADPVAGQIGFMGVIQDKNKPVLLGARLKLVDGKITEIDHMVSPLNGPLPAGLQKPRPGLITKLDKPEHTPRAVMLHAANAYYDAIEMSDGKVAPFADECQRRENGMTSANNQDAPPAGPVDPSMASMAAFGKMKCGEQLSTGIMGYITKIDQRRLFAVDEEMGLVMVYSMFNHDGDPNPLKIKGMPGVTESPNNWGKFSVPAAHIYKIKDGKIYEIEAMAIVGVPYQVDNGWDCTRKCLVTIMDQYLAALPKHDPSGVPLAKDVKLVENTEKTSIGKGLWKTATGGPTNFKVYAADPDQGQIGFIGVIENENKPTIVSVRLKVVDGKITEIDHLVVPAGKDPLNPNMSQVRPGLLERLPKEQRVHRNMMQRIANSYYEAIVQDNGKVAPFADECQRRENGGISANDQTQTPEEAAKDDFSVFRKMSCSDQLSTGVMSYIEDINRRRVFAVDEEMGLVFAYSIFVHNGMPKVMKIVGVPGVTERKNDYGPFDLPAAHIFKIRNGKIYEIEAIGYMAKHGIKNGWE